MPTTYPETVKNVVNTKVQDLMEAITMNETDSEDANQVKFEKDLRLTECYSINTLHSP